MIIRFLCLVMILSRGEGMSEKYYATIYCSVKVRCEIMADGPIEAKEKAWIEARNKMPGAEHPTIFVESESQRKEDEAYIQFLEWKRIKLKKDEVEQ